MTQSNVIAGALVVAFLMFITVRGELPEYIRLFVKKREQEKSGGGDSGIENAAEEVVSEGADLALDATINYITAGMV